MAEPSQPDVLQDDDDAGWRARLAAQVETLTRHLETSQRQLAAVHKAVGFPDGTGSGVVERIETLTRERDKHEGRAIAGWAEVAHLEGHLEDYRQLLTAAEQRHAALVAVVKRVQDKRETLEWNGDRGMEYTAPIVCPACNEPEHTADCPLDALLAYPLGDTTP